MSMWSTFVQTLSVKDGINGKNMMDKFIEDKLIILGKNEYTGKDEWQFNPKRFGHAGTVNFTCFNNPTYNIMDFMVSPNDHEDFDNLQYRVVRFISRLYPDIRFNYSSSYCPGGCEERVSDADEVFLNGRLCKEAAV